MLKIDNKILEEIQSDKWKNSNKKYLFELQHFLDLADNIENEELKLDIIGQMLRCDDILTKISKNMFKEYHLNGIKIGKKV